MKRAHDTVSSFVFLVSASLTSGFRLLLSSYGRLFIKFLLTKIADDTIAGAFSLETAQCAFNVFVFTNSNRRHSFFTILCLCVNSYSVIITIQKAYVKDFYGVFKAFLQFFPQVLSNKDVLWRISQSARNLPQDACKSGKCNRGAILPLHTRIRKFCTPISCPSFPFLPRAWV